MRRSVQLRSLKELTLARFTNTMTNAEHAPAMASPVRTDEQIMPRNRWVPIGKSNCYLNEEKSQPNPIFKIVVDILKQTNFFRAFTASSTIPAIYPASELRDRSCMRRGGEEEMEKENGSWRRFGGEWLGVGGVVGRVRDGGVGAWVVVVGRGAVAERQCRPSHPGRGVVPSLVRGLFRFGLEAGVVTDANSKSEGWHGRNGCRRRIERSLRSTTAVPVVVASAVEILLKMNLPDHRSVLTDPEDQAKMEMETPRSSGVNSPPNAHT
ncbi:hypothetical protein Tco_0422787 [Tanacetum coccineum]